MVQFTNNVFVSFGSGIQNRASTADVLSDFACVGAKSSVPEHLGTNSFIFTIAMKVKKPYILIDSIYNIPLVVMRIFSM